MSSAITREALVDPRTLHASSVAAAAPRRLTLGDFPTHLPLKWSWACRELVPHRHYQVLPQQAAPPQPGDVALVQIDKLGYHGKIATSDQGRLRLYPCDALVGVFGNRYATDAYEGRVESTDSLHLLTGGGMLGTVVSRHKKMKAPTQCTFLGYLADEQGERLNLKSLQFRPTRLPTPPDNVVLLIGTGMNSGKTTTGTKLVKALLAQGLRVSVCKLTGSVSHNDLYEMRATGAHDVRDFSDYGFPSTYLCDCDELLALFQTMLADAAQVEPDVVVMEIADGLLQRETRMLLQHELVRSGVRGVVHTAGCAASALYGVAQLEQAGHKVIAVSGLITSSPLFVRELAEHCTATICSSTDSGEGLAGQVMQACRNEC